MSQYESSFNCSNNRVKIENPITISKVVEPLSGDIVDVIVSSRSQSSLFEKETVQNEAEEPEHTIDNNLNLHQKGKINVEETKREGSVSLSLFGFYASNSGVSLTVLTLSMYMLFAGAKIMSDIWIGWWITDKYDLETSQYVLIYLYFATGLFCTLIIRSIFFGKGVSNAGYNIFMKVFFNVIKRPMEFFDTTPVGQILGRFVNDQNDTDMRIPFMFNEFLGVFFTFLGTFVLLCVVSPFHLLIIVIFFFMIASYMKKYVLTTTELKRMNKISEAPIISTLSELMQGNVLIRHYGQTENFKSKMVKHLDLH